MHSYRQQKSNKRAATTQQLQEFHENQEFIQNMDLLLRKTVDFLSDFEEGATFKLRTLLQRITSIERKLDFVESSLIHCDPSKRGAKPIPFKGSVFDSRTRSNLIQQHFIQKQNVKRSVLTEIHNVIKPKRGAPAISIQTAPNKGSKRLKLSNDLKPNNPNNARSELLVPPNPPPLRSKMTVVPERDFIANDSSRSAMSERTPSPTLSSIDSSFFTKDGRIMRSGSLHREYGPPPNPSRSPSPIGRNNKEPPMPPIPAIPGIPGIPSMPSSSVGTPPPIPFIPFIPIDTEKGRKVSPPSPPPKKGKVPPPVPPSKNECGRNDENDEMIAPSTLVPSTKGSVEGMERMETRECEENDSDLDNAVESVDEGVPAPPPPPPPPPPVAALNEEKGRKVSPPAPPPKRELVKKGKAPPPVPPPKKM